MSERSVSEPAAAAGPRFALWSRFERGWLFAAALVALAVATQWSLIAPFGTGATLYMFFRLVLKRLVAGVGDDVARRIVLWAYDSRAALALMLYVVSSQRLPLFVGQQLGGGFWTFAVDATLADKVGRQILQAYEHGTLFPRGHGAGIFFLITAAEYAVTGAHVLHATLFNVAYAAMAALVAYLIGRRLAGVRAARTAALLVGFWPSFFLWSTQPLREALTTLFVLTALYLLIRLYQDVMEPRVRPRTRTLVLLTLGVLPMMFVLVSGPALYALTMTLACGAVFICGAAVLVYRSRGALAPMLRSRGALGATVLVAVVLLAFAGTFGGRTIELMYAFEPWTRTPFPGDEPPPNVKQRGVAPPLFPGDEPPPNVKQRGVAPPLLLPDDGAPKASPAERKAAAERAERRRSTALSDSRLGVLANTIEIVSERAPVPSVVASRTTQFLRRLAVLPVDLASLRDGQKAAFGSTMLYPDQDVSSFEKIARFLPKAFFTSMFAPFPLQALQHGATAGALRHVSIVETLLIYPLLAFAVLAFLRGRRRGEYWLLFLFGIAGMTVLSLTIVNLGALFRYRVTFLLGLMMLAAATRPAPQELRER